MSNCDLTRYKLTNDNDLDVLIVGGELTAQFLQQRFLPEGHR